jgi:hypothetical protein
MASEQLVTLFGKTDGRDKLLKAAAGLAKFTATYTNSEQHTKLAASLSEGRSIMRLVGWLNNIQKFRTQPTQSLADRMMVARLGFDMFYCIHDNLAYLTKYKALQFVELNTAIYRSFVGLFWGFLFAVALDIHALVTGNLSGVELRKRVLMLVRNCCDLFSALHNVGYAKGVGFELSARVLGLLGFISGAISCQENWEGCAPKPGDKKKA